MHQDAISVKQNYKYLSWNLDRYSEPSHLRRGLLGGAWLQHAAALREEGQDGGKGSPGGEEDGKKGKKRTCMSIRFLASDSH